MGYYIMIGVITLISTWVQNRLKSKFKKYSQIHLRNGLSGKEIAEKMLADNRIHDVKVISTPGRLTDHYNPANKTVNLSEAVYNERNAAAAAVAAHECGHALQHAQAYSWLTFRSKMVPAVQFSSRFWYFLLLAGIGLMAMQGAMGITVVYFALALFSLTTLFAFVTLPVEYDASKRALAWLKNYNMVTPDEYEGSEDALRWAARTYVVGAIGSLAQLLYFALQFAGRRD